MNLSLFQDRRTAGLLKRVREDVTLLRADLGNLLSDTTHRTLPNGAQELADRAKHQLAAGSAYAASRLRNLRTAPRQPAWLLGGAALLGLIVVGAYALCNHGCASQQADGYEAEEDVDA